eukprot:15365123-Ditylum_brightwellii.AAC.1
MNIVNKGNRNANEGKCIDCIPKSNKMSALTGLSKKYLFPLKLMRVLSMEEYSDVITWLPDGRAFVIISPSKLVSIVIPLFFKRAKYSSFLRKLVRWGFQRNRSGKDIGSFCHKNPLAIKIFKIHPPHTRTITTHQQHFQRDNEELCKKIRPFDTLALMDTTQSGKKNQDTYGDCQNFQYQCKEKQSDIADVSKERYMVGADTSNIQVSSRSVDCCMAGIQAPAKALYWGDDLAHNKLHQTTTRRKQGHFFAELNASSSRLIDHNTIESNDNVKSSTDVSLVQKMMDVYLTKKLLSYYDARYNSLLLQHAIDYSSSLQLQLDYNLPKLRIMRQLNANNTEFRSSGDFIAVPCEVKSPNDQDHVPIHRGIDGSFVTL